MCILGPDNKVFARMRVHHNVSDFKKACGLLKRAEKEFDMIPLIIMEATGHYHRLLFRFLKNAGYKVIVVNPIQTDSIKNISVRKVKNDKVDAYRIAILYRLKELRPTNMPVEAISDIRNLCRQYAVVHKLVYIIFAVLRDQKPFVLRTPVEHKKLLALKASQHQKKTA
ncbi:hypothetical protein H0A61_00432 [Koleobacter methoxysyntrophicus]|uniref:Transposase IS110-like N-terminal domain-containing protein n=1 Tax=Koleobacter methoxysyntrophicus TaxID=2751313 RepID=A0A8A0RJQ6_9FIRM|nr:transposase [Koleobacter methoxysyntrophicus]QSQ08112.1 hypothetical protein H0A61_00432 [Koleobacter methoxysyntrophicus]